MARQPCPEIDDELLNEVYGKEYIGPMRSTSNNAEAKGNANKRPLVNEQSDEENESGDPIAVSTDFTIREDKVWEAKAKAIERNRKKRKEEEMICKLCGEYGHFTQVIVCWQCGDIGISEALVFCIECKNAARHSYCLDEVPEDLTAEIDWLCEDCRRKPTPTSLGILDYGSGRPVIGPKNPCQEIGSANDHLVNSRDQHPVSNVRIGSSVNLDNHISYDLKKAFSCATDGALGIISSSACFKQNDDGIEEFGNENSKKERLMLLDKDKLDHSQPQDTNIQFAAKILSDIFVEASDEQIIGGTSKCDIGGLGAGRSSICFGLKEDEIDESEKEMSKERGLILPVKDELNSFHPIIDGEGTNFSSAIKGIPDTSFEPFDNHIIEKTARYTTNEFRAVGSSACYKQEEEEEIELYEKRKPNCRRLILQTNNFHSLIDSQITSISFLVKKFLGTPVEQSGMERTLSNYTNTLDALKSPVCFTPKENEIEEYEKGDPKRKAIVPCKDRLDNSHPVIDRHGTNISFAVERLVCSSIEPSDNKTSKRTSNCGTNASGAIGSSTCFEFKGGQIEEHKVTPLVRMIIPGMDQLNDIHSPIDGQDSSIRLAAKRFTGASIGESDKQTIEGTSRCSIGSLGIVRSSACFKLKEGEIEAHSKTRRRRRRRSSGAVGSSTCFKFKGGQIEDHKVTPMARMIIPGMDQLNDIHSPIDGQGSSIRLAAKRFSGASIGESGKQTIEGTSRCSIGSLGILRSSACFKLKEGEIEAQSKTRQRRRRRSSRRTLIPPVSRERENFHTVIFCQGDNIPVVAKGVPSIPVKASNKQIIRRIKTSDTLGEIRSSVCFELEKDEMDRCKNDKLESRSLILPTEDELNNSHAVIDRRDTNMKLAATKIPGTSVVPSDKHTRWVNTESQIKFPCQLVSHSSPLVFHVWRGCFNIYKAEIGPLRGHLSSGACLKVYNLARKLPLVLHMQKLPRLVAWPNSFKVSSPTVDNIALYFFPESDRVETVLNELVDDLINKDLMLRFAFDEVELLVFSSFVLPQEHQSIFGKYYPWGVFKPRSSKICSLPAGSHTG